jgi:hypothetical protein
VGALVCTNGREVLATELALPPKAASFFTAVPVLCAAAAVAAFGTAAADIAAATVRSIKAATAE